MLFYDNKEESEFNTKWLKEPAAAYIRVSTDKDDQENSFEVQQRYFENLLSDNDRYSNAGIYCDYGISGTSLKNRTALQSLLNDCKKGKVKRIICKSMSRMSRNVQDLIQILRFLKEHNVTIYFEKENIDTADSVNEIAVTTLAAIAEKESRSIAENINWANEKRHQSGEVPNEVMYGYHWSDDDTMLTGGYKYRNIKIDPAEAEIVKRIYEDAANGIKYSNIARKLNAENITPPEAFGRKRKDTAPCKKWSGRHIRNIISNERYTGCVMTQKTFTADPAAHKRKENKGEMGKHLVMNHHPAIISMELFKKAQTMRKRNSKIYGNNKTGSRRTQTLSGLLLCPDCGRRFHTNGRNRMPYWFCPEKCGKRIDETVAFKLIEKALYIRFGLDNGFKTNIKRILTVTETYGELKNAIHRELDSVERRSAALTVQKGILAQKAATLTDTKAQMLLHTSMNLLQKTIEDNISRCDTLKQKYENLLSAEKCYLKYADTVEGLLTLLDKESDIDMIVEKILHQYIKAIISEITILSSSSISVKWIDNSVTIIEQ